MNSFCRRNFSKLAISLLFTCYFRQQACSASVSNPSELEPFEPFARSGDDDFDEALIIELKRICQVFDINPGFKYVNVMNAYAMPGKVIVKGTNGSVYLGLPLVKKLLEKDDGGAAVAGVCAHECGHIFQYKKRLFVDQDRVDIGSMESNFLAMELHADFLAGYYMGRRGALVNNQIKAFSSAVYEFGSYNFDNNLTHGTPGQRAAAVDKGYRTAVDGRSVDDAAIFGLMYVRQL
jgi:hypothetical protein